MKSSKKISMTLFIIGVVIGIQFVVFFTSDKVNFGTTQEYPIVIPEDLKIANGIDIRREWNQSGILGEYREDHIKILAKDSEDNLYVGSSYELSSTKYGALTKFDKDGILQWERTYSTPNSGMYLRSINVDSSDNIYLTGNMYDYLGDYKVILIKYNSSGDLQWDVVWGLEDEDESAFAIDFDSIDNVYVAGSIWHDYTISSMFYAKFNSTGDYKMNTTVSEFVDYRYGGAPVAYDIAIDQFDNIYLAGKLFGNASVVKFDSAGNNLWNQTYNYDSLDNDEAMAIEVDATGIYVAAHITGTSDPRYRIIKYDFMGNEIWNTFDIGDQDVYGISAYMNDLKLDSMGNIYVVGRTSISSLNMQKFNSSGNYQWGLVDSDLDIYAGGRGLAIDSSDNLYISGGQENDLILAKYSSKPEITILAPLEEETFGKVAPYYDISIFEPDLDQMWCTLTSGSAPITSLSGQVDQALWDNLGDGYHGIKFFANDTYGNQDFAQVNVYKDLRGPTVEILSPSSGSRFSYNPSYRIDVSDFQSKFVKVWYTIDGGITNITLTSISYSEYYDRFEGAIDESEWSKASAGQITFRVYAEDTHGNLNFEELSLIKDLSIPGFDLLLIITISVIGGVAFIGVAIFFLIRRRK